MGAESGLVITCWSSSRILAAAHGHLRSSGGTARKELAGRLFGRVVVTFLQLLARRRRLDQSPPKAPLTTQPPSTDSHASMWVVGGGREMEDEMETRSTGVNCGLQTHSWHSCLEIARKSNHRRLHGWSQTQTVASVPHLSRANSSSYEETFAQRLVAKTRIYKSLRTKSFRRCDPDELRPSR